MKKLFSSLVLLLSSQVATAALIDFEDTIDQGWYQPTINSGDYTFEKQGGWMGANDYSAWLPAGANNHSRDLEMGFGLFTLSRQDNDTFDLQQLDAGLSWYNYDLTDTLTVTGYLNSGGTVSSTLTLNHDYQGFSFTNFVNLDYVTFSGHAIATGYVALDNLSLIPTTSSTPPPINGSLKPTPPVNVPEPMILPLFALGLIGLRFARFKSPGTCT